MFGLPNAKRVCRDDLHSPCSSRASSPAESTIAKYAASAFERAFSALDIFTAAADDVSATTNLEHTKDEDEEQEFEFRLFRSQPAQVEARTKSPGKDQAEHDNGNGVRKLKIRVRSPTPTPQGSGEGRFLNPFRGWEYYFTDPEMVIQTVGGNNSHQQSKQKSNEEQQRLLAKEKFGDVAITGDQILAGAALGPMAGCRLPWRVIHLPPTQSKLNVQKKSLSTSKQSIPEPEKPRHKTKPGKKRRIMLRKRSRAKEAAEEADKEKRNKRNREKKIKRRQRERDKKAAARGTEEPVNGQAGTEPASET